MEAEKMCMILEGYCKKGNLDAFLQESTPEMDMPVLLVFLGMDSQSRERTAQITVIHQEMGEGLAGGPKEGKSFFTLNIRVPLPCEINDNAHSDLCSAVCYVNSNLMLPGFEYHEGEDHLLFRHVLLVREDLVSETQILSILGWIIFTLDLYAATLGEVASGKMTFDELIQQVIDYSQKLLDSDFSRIDENK